MSRTWKQELAHLAWLLVQICPKVSVFIYPDMDAQKVNTPCLDITLKSKLDGVVERVAEFDKDLPDQTS